MRARTAAAAVGMALLPGCALTTTEPLPSWTFSPSMFFPPDDALDRPEDGVALEDGRLIVADRAHGLRLVHPDGTSEPFGDMPGAGYTPAAPNRNGAANGVTLEPDGTHLLVADVLDGGLYRVALSDGSTERLYRHPFGINTARRDSTGAIWFTQSTRNTSTEGEARMFAAVNRPMGDGVLYYLPLKAGRLSDQPVTIRGGLDYANGLVLDEPNAKLYVSECIADRVWQADLDVQGGRADGFTVLAQLPTPDNLELDALGRLWVVSPLSNRVGIIDTQTGSIHLALDTQTPGQAAILDEYTRRGVAGESRLELFTPELWAPHSSFITGIIHAPDGSAYVTGLGSSLVRLDRPANDPMTDLHLFATRYAAAWSGQDPRALASFYAEDGRLRVNGGEPSTGRDAIAAKASAFMDAFPDMRVRLERLVPSGRGAVFHWHWTGTYTGPGGNGAEVDLRGHETWTLTDDGLIAVSDGRYDEAEYERQINAGNHRP